MRIRGGSGRPFAPGGPRGFRASTLRPLKSHLDLRKLSFGSNPLTSISPRVPKLGIMGLPILSKKRQHGGTGATLGIRDLASNPVPKYKVYDLGQVPSLLLDSQLQRLPVSRPSVLLSKLFRGSDALTQTITVESSS